MAEYFPLLDRAVSGLPDQTLEARRSIYDRARTALIGQLRGMQPPIDEENIERENQALDAAIARIEARYLAPVEPKRIEPSAPATEPALPRPALSQRPRPPLSPRTSVAAPAADVRAPGLPTGKAPPVVPPPTRDRPARPPLAAAAAGIRTGSPSRNSAVRPVMELRPGPAAQTEPVAEAVTDTTQDPDKARTLPPVGVLSVPEEAKTDFGTVLDTAVRENADEAVNTVRPRDSGLRPQAPRPAQPRRFGPAAISAAAIVLVLMVGIGIAAWRLRDRPDQMTAATQGQMPGPSDVQPGKIVERASRPAERASRPTDPAAQPDDDVAAGGAILPAPVGSDGSPTDQAAPQSSGATVDSGIAVAQRAALLVDAPDDPQKVKTYPGTVVWHLDSVSPGQGQPLEAAVKADIDIPDAKLKITMLMQKNPEPQLPASHTVEFHFLPQTGNTLGNVKQINVPEMRKDDDAQTGDSLTGVPVAITENYFLVGLSRGAAESQNLRLLTERNWFDLSVLFAPNKLGKITFEKGGSGQHVLEDALKSWH